jgi:anti-sigma factor RsiW
MTDTQNTGVWRRIKGLMLKNMHRMLTCREFEEFVLDYLDGTLPERQRSMFEWHMRICRECRDYLAAYRRAMAVSQRVLSASDKPVPDDVPEDLIKAILESRKQ